jgi:hypothetical protein
MQGFTRVSPMVWGFFSLCDQKSYSIRSFHSFCGFHMKCSSIANCICFRNHALQKKTHRFFLQGFRDFGSNVVPVERVAWHHCSAFLDIQHTVEVGFHPLQYTWKHNWHKLHHNFFFFLSFFCRNLKVPWRKKIISLFLFHFRYWVISIFIFCDNKWIKWK